MNEQNDTMVEKKLIAQQAWERCRRILSLRWAWSLVWVEPWQLPLAWPGFCRLSTHEVLLDRELSLEGAIVTIACEARQAALYEAGKRRRDEIEGKRFARWFFVTYGLRMTQGDALA